MVAIGKLRSPKRLLLALPALARPIFLVRNTTDLRGNGKKPMQHPQMAVLLLKPVLAASALPPA